VILSAACGFIFPGREVKKRGIGRKIKKIFSLVLKTPFRNDEVRTKERSGFDEQGLFP
jgi:hypothetical protein